MTLPVLQKTWQNSINQTVVAQGSIAATEKRLIRTIKNLLIGFGLNPWAVRSSNDGAGGFGNGDSVDRWTSDAAIVKNSAGSNHSWIVLRQTGIATNFEVCLDMNSASNASMSIIVSPSAGFGSGLAGTATARPTATDEIVLISSTTWFSGVDTQHQIHAQQSTDGQCTRVQVWRGSTNQCTFWLFDKPSSPTAGWTNPSVSFVLASATGIATVNSTLVGVGIASGRGTATMAISLTGEAQGTSQLSQLTNIGSVANDFDAAWPFFPIGLCCVTLAGKGRQGYITDLWWSQIGTADSDTFPNSSTAKQFVRFGGLIFPWTAGADVPLIT